jgi:hypothetical protein
MDATEDRSPSWASYGADQIFVERLARRIFGDRAMDSTVERGRRVVEEALELAQVEGVPEHETHAIVKAKYAKAKGEVRQEAGGLIVTLLALCAHHELRLDDLAKAEIERMLSPNPESFRAKQREKADLGIAERPE